MQHVPQGARVLDVGCGAGLWLFLLARFRQIAEGVGIEVDARKVATANALRRPDEKLRFLSVDPGDQWPQQEFDSLTMIDVLHHVTPDHQKPLLQRIAETSVRRILFKDIDPAMRLRRTMNTLHDLVVTHQRPWYRPVETVCRWIEEAGFVIREQSWAPMFWYGHYFVVADRAA